MPTTIHVSQTWLQRAILSALALPMTACPASEEGVACLAVPENRICPSKKAAAKKLVGDHCGYDVLRVTGPGVIELRYPEGGYQLDYYDQNDAGPMQDGTTTTSTSSETGTSTQTSETTTLTGTETTTDTVWPGAMEMCCYPVIQRDDPNDGCTPGRPCFIAGQLTFAAIERGDSWHAALALQEVALDEATRSEIGNHWLQVALGEHASIAAFSRLSLELLTFGAPATLVQACQQAALDEVKHAQGAFSIASFYLGRSVSAGPLPLGQSLALAASIEDMMLAAINEGCVEETLSALVAKHSAMHVDDPVLGAWLHTVAQDEARHAALSWKILQWGLSQAPELTSLVDQVFADDHGDLTRIQSFENDDASEVSQLRGHGVVAAPEIARLKASGRRAVIASIWQQLRATTAA